MAQNGNLVGPPTSVAGATNFGNAFSFSGSGQRIDLPGGSYAAGTSQFPGQFPATASFRLHAKIKTNSTGVRVISGYNDQGAGSTFWMGINAAGQAIASVGGLSGGAQFGAATTVNDNAWHDIDLVVTGGTSAQLYVDGTASGAAVTGQFLAPTTGTLQIGALNNGFYWLGLIDEFAIFSSSAAPTLQTAPYSNTIASIVNLYHFDDGTATDTANVANPPPTVYTATDATGPAFGAALTVMVPNSTSAKPYNAANPTPLVIFAHGAGGDNHELTSGPTSQIAQAVACRDALLNLGCIIAATATRSSMNWGNQASVDDQADLYRYCQANYNIGPVIIWAQSMGGLDGLLTLAEDKVLNIAGFIGTYPVANLANLNSLGVYTANINAAYAITGSGTATYGNMTFGHDPLLKAPLAYRGARMLLLASPADGTVPKAQNTDLLAALVAGSTSECTVITCSGAHGDPSHYQASLYAAFVQRCLASPPPTSGLIGGAASGPPSPALAAAISVIGTQAPASGTVDVTAQEFGNWLRDLPQVTLVGVQVQTTDPITLVRQNPVWQYLLQSKGRAVDGLVAGYLAGRTTDLPWMTTFNAACAATLTSGQAITAIDALNVFDAAFPLISADISERPLTG